MYKALCPLSFDDEGDGVQMRISGANEKTHVLDTVLVRLLVVAGQAACDNAVVLDNDIANGAARIGFTFYDEQRFLLLVCEK